jgi:hypothetical protein
MGEINKGYFKTNEGEKIKLILHSKQSPFILIEKKDGNRVFYNSPDKNRSIEIWSELKNVLPSIIKESLE